MKTIKINTVLNIDTFYNLFTERDQAFLKENPIERNEDAINRVASVILKNKIKALEIPGITFNVDSEYLNPSTILEKKRKREEASAASWQKAIATMVENSKKSKEAVISGKNTNLSIENIELCISTLESMAKKTITPKVTSEEDAMLEKNIGNILLNVAIDINDSNHEDSAQISILKTVFDDCIQRLCANEKRVKTAKSEDQ